MQLEMMNFQMPGTELFLLVPPQKNEVWLYVPLKHHKKQVNSTIILSPFDWVMYSNPPYSKPCLTAWKKLFPSGCQDNHLITEKTNWVVRTQTSGDQEGERHEHIKDI